MTDFDLDPEELLGIATSTRTALSALETHRSSTSTGVDAAIGSVQSAEVAASLANVWNVLLAPQFEGAEQRGEKLSTGLNNVAAHYDAGNDQMMRDAVASTDAAVDVGIEDAKTF
jgi:cellobiose-specific phosphotransferase system component IIB